MPNHSDLLLLAEWERLLAISQLGYRGSLVWCSFSVNTKDGFTINKASERNDAIVVKCDHCRPGLLFLITSRVEEKLQGEKKTPFAKVCFVTSVPPGKCYLNRACSPPLWDQQNLCAFTVPPALQRKNTFAWIIKRHLMLAMHENRSSTPWSEWKSEERKILPYALYAR